MDVVEIYTGLEWSDGEEEFDQPDYEASVTDGDYDTGDFEDVFRRLQHVYIECFSFDISEAPFMQYWRAQDADFTVKEIDFEERNKILSSMHRRIAQNLVPEVADYGTVDSVVNIVR